MDSLKLRVVTQVKGTPRKGRPSGHGYLQGWGVPGPAPAPSPAPFWHMWLLVLPFWHAQGLPLAAVLHPTMKQIGRKMEGQKMATITVCLSRDKDDKNSGAPGCALFWRPTFIYL